MIRFNIIKDIIKGILTSLNVIDFFILENEHNPDYRIVASINIPVLQTNVYIHIYFRVKILFLSDYYKIAIRLY